MLLKSKLGEVVEQASISSEYACALAKFITAEHTPYVRLVECRSATTADVLIIEVDVEIAARRPVSISGTELLAVWCNRDLHELPQVFPLREDFPTDQLHVMVDVRHQFVSLCLWEISSDELKTRFTPFMFLSRLKQWLELSADGDLHDDNQPPEPVLVGFNTQVIIPEGIDCSKRYTATGWSGQNDRLVVRFADRVADNEASDGPLFSLFPLVTEPVESCAVRYAPRLLGDLALLLDEHGIDLLDSLSKWVTSAPNDENLPKSMLVVLITFPKLNHNTGAIEGDETAAFGLALRIEELCVALGTHASEAGHLVPILGNKGSVGDAEKIQIEPMLILREIGSSDLSQLSGTKVPDNLSLAAVGVGALGSRVVELCARGGFGRWEVFDEDILLPHNLVRHILGDWAVGQAKADHVMAFVNSLVPGMPVEKSHEIDVLSLDRDEGIDARKAIEALDLIVDMSASVSVARELAQRGALSRCVSVFLNPSADDLVMLGEDVERGATLFDIEGAYYAALVRDERLCGHLSGTEDRQIRYGNGCRDVTTQISAEKISILGGLAATAVRNFAEQPGSLATVWRTHPNGEVKTVNLEVPRFHQEVIEDWSVSWSISLIHEMSEARDENLPNETGGVLLGVVDFARKTVIISAMEAAPADSVKKPHFFERGSTGLEKRLQEIGDVTAGQLRYVGEWHSHPQGVTSRPSDTDDILFSLLQNMFMDTGEPFVMAIKAEDSFFWRIGVNEMVGEREIVVD